MTTRDRIALLAAAMRAYDRVFGLNEHLVACGECGATWYGYDSGPCDWCARRRQADAEHVLTPPAPRGYGYATEDDLRALGIDPEADRCLDLERWRHDLQVAVDADLITEAEGTTAWLSATNDPKNSTLSIGSRSSTATTSTKMPSSWVSPIEGVGPLSQAQRKAASRHSSSSSHWKQPGME